MDLEKKLDVRASAYRPSSITIAESQPARDAVIENSLNIPTWIWYLVSLIPAYAVGLSYLSWLVAWTFLGRTPIPNVDDPYSIHFVVTAFVTVSQISLAVSPLIVPVSFFFALYYPSKLKRTWAVRLTIILMFLALYASLVVLLFADPNKVIEWLGD